LADTANGGDLVPAPVLARTIMRQVEHGDFELYMPYVAHDLATGRAGDLATSMAMMAAWYERGAPTGSSS
jgi:hypothetical protein